MYNLFVFLFSFKYYLRYEFRVRFKSHINHKIISLDLLTLQLSLFFYLGYLISPFLFIKFIALIKTCIENKRIFMSQQNFIVHFLKMCILPFWKALADIQFHVFFGIMKRRIKTKINSNFDTLVFIFGCKNTLIWMFHEYRHLRKGRGERLVIKFVLPI